MFPFFKKKKKMEDKSCKVKNLFIYLFIFLSCLEGGKWIFFVEDMNKDVKAFLSPAMIGWFVAEMDRLLFLSDVGLLREFRVAVFYLFLLIIFQCNILV